MSIGDSMVHQRLVKPTKMAMRYCEQLLNGNDHFKRKATDELLDSQLVRINYIGEATEEFVVGLKLDILEAEFRHKLN
ncbi:hypothetical protein niasHT_017959 [Heterodera trifolii]|uniref:Uncharacterized protein n=1 Tax=Heterodera trifolii TaxID=157864 RepID=A0ABD2LIQ4_9BILA